MSEDVVATLGGRACPVCGSSVRAAVDAGPFQLFSCAHCRSWCSDAHQRGAATSFTPESYFENDRADLSVWRDLRGRLAARRLGVRSVLDVGCGTGAFLSHLTGLFPDAQVEGIELDPDRAQRARQLNPQAHVHTGDAVAALDAVKGRFDLITLWDVFEHVTQPGVLLRGLAQRLSDGGCLFIQTIHEDSITPRLGRLSYRWSGGRVRALVRRTHDAHHLVFFSRRGLLILAESAGLEIREQWFGRLMRARMDGHPLVTRATAIVLWLENVWGNGLFVNQILTAATKADVSPDADRRRADP